jgi:hypothetical protein
MSAAQADANRMSINDRFSHGPEEICHSEGAVSDRSLHALDVMRSSVW